MFVKNVELVMCFHEDVYDDDFNHTMRNKYLHKNITEYDECLTIDSAISKSKEFGFEKLKLMKIKIDSRLFGGAWINAQAMNGQPISIYNALNY